MVVSACAFEYDKDKMDGTCKLCHRTYQDVIHHAHALEFNTVYPHEKTSSATQAILLECIELMQIKSSDYDHPTRTRGDGLENFRASAELGVPAWVGALTRTSDKWERIKTLTFKLMTKGEGPAVKDETLEDTLKDIINYGAIVLALYREWKAEQPTNKENPLTKNIPKPTLDVMP